MKKLFSGLIIGLLFSVGNVFAVPQYTISGGNFTTFTEANGLGIVQPGESFAGYEFKFGWPVLFGFPDPVQATFTTTHNTIDFSSGVIGVVAGDSNGFLFDNQSSTLTVSPLFGDYSLRLTDFNLPGLPGTTDSFIVGAGRTPQSADPWVGIIPLGDNEFTIFGLFDQRIPSEGTFAINVSIPEVIAPPVPEPETYAMLLVGLGFVAYTVRKRRNSGIMPMTAGA